MESVTPKMILLNLSNYEKLRKGSDRINALHIPSDVEICVVRNMPDNEAIIMERFVDPRDIEQLIHIFGYYPATKLLNSIPTKRV